MRKHLLAAAAVLALATPASAQMFEGYDRNLGYDGFRTGLTDTGRFQALDRDKDLGLNENEFATGVYLDYDRDKDRMISEDEFTLGGQRYYGADYDGVFADYDTDADGFLNRDEYRSFYDRNLYGTYDADADGLLTEDEYGTGVYGRADADQDKVISVEEESWFEGWFDGNDIEVEVEEVGDVL